MYNPGNLKNNGANQDDVQKRNNENFVGRNMSLISNNAVSFYFYLFSNKTNFIPK